MNYDADKFLPVKISPDMFIFAVEFDQAEFMEGQDDIPSPTTTGIEYTTLEMNRSEIPSNGVRIWTNPDSAKMQRADTGRYFVMTDLWLASDQQRKVAKLYPELSYQEYLDTQVDLLRKLMKRNGERVWWGLCGEQDGGVIWPDRFFKNKKEAYEYYRECYFGNDPSRYPNATRKMADFVMMKERYGIDFQKENIAMQVSKCFSTHYPYEWGARFAWCERTGSLGNAQIAVAFMRGAASQYGGYWGIDVSGWGGCVPGACLYDETGNQLCGITDSLMLREIVSYFYSGTNLVHLESTASSCWIKDKNNKFKLSPYGEKCKKFGQHVLIDHPDRGKTCVPFAVMLEHDHGWDPRDRRIWNGCVEYGPGDQMIDDFFNFIFPGQEDNCYIINGLDDKDCFDRMKAAENPGVQERDWRELEKGVLATSRFGDSFDVVLENCPLDVLKRYKVVVVAGAIKINPELQEKLKQYVESGGKVVLNIKHLDNPDPEFTGFKSKGETLSYPKFFTSWGNAWDEGPSILEMVELADNTKVIVEARRSYQPDTCAISRKKIGHGEVYTSMIHYNRKAPGKPLAPHYQDFLSWLFNPYLPVKVEGNHIQHIVSEKDNSIIVTLINNKPELWNGKIIINKPGVSIDKVKDLWGNKNLSAAGSVSIDVSCNKFDFRILEINTVKER